MSVDLDLDINLEIKPRSQNGVVFSVKGESDYLVMQLVNGEVCTVTICTKNIKVTIVAGLQKKEHKVNW